MRPEHLRHLVCPACKNTLVIAEIEQQHDGRIETGVLACSGCAARYNIIHHIPRFVPADNYASTFGFQWLKHARTQYDSQNGTHITETRLFEETRWSHQLSGQLILEVGSGSGRFTEPLIATGAMVVSLDYSQAVEANYSSNGAFENVLIIQGDIYHMPFPEGSFDKVLCIGVLQHTPDVDAAFQVLPRFLKSGGNLVVDVYAKASGMLGVVRHLFKTRYWVRSPTRRLKSEDLYRYCSMYINWMWPLAGLIGRIPSLGHRINWFLLIPDYRQRYPLSNDLLKEWAILDLFDILSPAYDQPQTIDHVRYWFESNELTNITVEYGYNGIEGRGTRGANPET